MFFRNKKITIEDRIKGAIIGSILGDAIGVNYEYEKNIKINLNNVGMWSDDSSLILCTVESLCNSYNLNDMVKMFLKWIDQGYWTPEGIVLDCGRTTALALSKIRKNNNDLTGLNNDVYCGNGSLMRIIPILFYIHKNKEDRFKIIEEVSSVTHSNMTCIIGCAIYLEFALNLLEGQDINSAYKNMQKTICSAYSEYTDVLDKYKRILFKDIGDLDIKELKSSGYVVDTLEASLYSFLNSKNYKSAITMAISFGNDTDTTACITGGLVGVYYGIGNIPKKLINKIIRINDINNLIEDFINSYKNDFVNIKKKDK